MIGVSWPFVWLAGWLAKRVLEAVAIAAGNAEKESCQRIDFISLF